MTLFICRGKNRGKTSSDVRNWTNEMDSQPSGSAAGAGEINNESGIGKIDESGSEVAVLSLQDRLKWAEQHVAIKVVLFPPSLDILIKLS